MLYLSADSRNTLAVQSTKLTNHPNQPSLSTRTINGKLPAGNNMGLGQAYILRNLSAKQALALGEEVAEELKDKIACAQGICALIKAWAEASDRIRILRGKPLPGSLRPEKKPTRKKQISTAPSEQPDQPEHT